MLNWIKVWFTRFFGLVPQQPPEAPPAQPRPIPPSAIPAPPAPIVLAPPFALPAPSPSPSPPKLYEGKAFDITADKRDAAKKILFVVQDGKALGPTSNQQLVIFCEEAGASVLAGAGSGKSTTLVSRILYLHKFENIAFDNIAVFTFTRKSRRDFVRKFLKEAKRWGIRLSKWKAERVVRTFHSKALQISKGLRAADEGIFEFLGSDISSHQEDDDEEADEGNVDEVIEESAEADAETDDEDKANKLPALALDLKMSDEQAEVLLESYRKCYANTPDFRQAIADIHTHTFETAKATPDAKYDEYIARLEWMSKNDVALCGHLEKIWSSKVGWPFAGMETRDEQGKRFALKVTGSRHPMYANGYIRELDLYIVLGPYENITNDPVYVGRTKLLPRYNSWAKRTVLLGGCNKRIRFIMKDRDIEELQTVLEVMVKDPNWKVAPALRLRLPGEFKIEPAFSALYKFGLFAENLGIPPKSMFDKLRDVELKQPGSLFKIELVSAFVTQEFFKYFDAECRQRNLVTFNELFMRLGKGSSDLDKLDVSDLIGAKHLMIDEFQDISPLVVKFVLGIHTALVEKSEHRQRPTLLCVGDDWQSIYGWRGSAPQFMLDFSRYFAGASKKSIWLEENFRSSQKIIACGETFIDQVKIKSTKRGIAVNPSFKDLTHEVIQIESLQSDDIAQVLEFILENRRTRETVQLLAAKGDDLASFKHIKAKGLVKTTFHQSKGLEADYVILLGANKQFGTFNLKNQLYKLAGLTQSFDDAQADEALRVAYVAVTRAKQICIWFGIPDGNVLETVPVDTKMRRQETIEGVLDLLQGHLSVSSA